jgi:endonuclease-3
LGIGVDTHIHRITNRLGWHTPRTYEEVGAKNKTKDVDKQRRIDQTRRNLESWFPKDLWPNINNRLVGFGQVICLPVNPRCDQCTLSDKGLCPSARKVTEEEKWKRAPGRGSKMSRAGKAKVEVVLEM